jgi:hemoglobin-like flavoprotein
VLHPHLRHPRSLYIPYSKTLRTIFTPLRVFSATLEPQKFAPLLAFPSLLYHQQADMTAQQISLVQNSWRLLRSVDPQLVADLFYTKLFMDHPEVRAMFPKNMDGQYINLINKLNFIIARLDHLEDLKSDLTALANRHVGYGVVPQQYTYVGAALLWTLERGLGADWIPQVAEAWQTCYGVLSSAMIQTSENNQTLPTT